MKCNMTAKTLPARLAVDELSSSSQETKRYITSLSNCVCPRASLRGADIWHQIVCPVDHMHGIRELCATQKTSFVNVLSVELRNSRLSLSSSHIGIRDDSGFAKISVAVQRLLSSVTLPVNQHSLPPQVARLAARRRRLGVRFDRDKSRVESFVLRRSGHPRRSRMRLFNVVRTC
jgi:hypothetical protein